MAILQSCPAQNIFADAGVEWKWYRYFDPATVGLDFEGLMEDLRAAPEGSVVVLHGDSSLTDPPVTVCMRESRCCMSLASDPDHLRPLR